MVVVKNASSQEVSEKSMLFYLRQVQARKDQFQLRPEKRNEVLKREMREMEEMFSRFSTMDQNLVPRPPAVSNMPLKINGGHVAYTVPATANVMHSNINGNNGQRRNKNGYDQTKRKMSGRTSVAQREDIIRRTVHVSDIDCQITEERLAALFLGCGQVVDCRVCGDPNSILHFAFVEFIDEDAAHAALTLSGTIIGFYPIKVLPSKTAIAPVNPTFLPRTLDEREMCARTVYVTNIDKKVTQADMQLFFANICGKVGRLRLLGDYHHPTRIAFVEFVVAESAMAALNCSGAILGSMPIRVSPSKTPIRTRAARLPFPSS